MRRPTGTLLVAVVLALAGVGAHGAVVYSQLPANPPAGGIPSQFWFDPTGQNNLDSDAAAYDDFTLARNATITRVEWWGEAGPSVGFFVSFYPQDTNTVALQPDLPQFYGHAPVADQEATNCVQTAVGNNQYHFSADLVTPVPLLANTRYFLALVDSMPTAYATWGWAQGFGGNGRTFYYQLAGSLAGGPYYTILPSDRAFILDDDSPALTCVCTATNTVVISWPTNLAGFVLQQNASLAAGNWVNATNAVNVVGAESQVLVSLPSESCLYRLLRP